MIKTGIMGGTFDPIHIGHLIIAQYAYEEFGLDEVWFMTSGNPPHKAVKSRCSAEIRHAMVKEALKGCANFKPCDYEVNRAQYSYSALTLKNLNEIYPDRDFYFIIGQDSLNYFDKWYHPEEIVKYAKILVFPRDLKRNLEEDTEIMRKKIPGDYIEVPMPLIGLSSTEIRRRIREKKSIKFMVPQTVEKYIEQRGLYI